MSRNANKRRIRVTAGEKLEDVVLEFEGEVEGGDPFGKGAGVAAGPAGDPEKFEFFVPIFKVDSVKHEVWGRATQEIRDAVNEKMDFVSSVPYFQKWSEETRKRSQGKSLGNVRAMHQPIAAGVLLQMDIKPVEKAVDVGIHVTDPVEWTKCETGTYTGLSVGGRYAKRWVDPQDNTVAYTADPNEISLVDAPCVPTATFAYVKADGSEEMRKFQSALTATTTDVGGSGIDVVMAPNPTAPVSLGVQAQPTAPATNTLVTAAHITDAVTETSTAGIQDTAPSRERNDAAPDVAALVSKLIERGKLVGITRRLTSPNGAAKADADWKQYGDPANWAFPCDTPENAQLAISKFNAKEGMGDYSAGEWMVLGRRLSRLAEAIMDKPYVFDAKNKAVKDASQEVQKMASLADVQSLIQTGLAGGAGSSDALQQAASLVGVMLDQASSTTTGGVSLSQASSIAVPAAEKAEDTTTKPSGASSTPGKDTPPALESDTTVSGASSSSSSSSSSSQPTSPSSTKTPDSSIPVAKVGQAKEANVAQTKLSTNEPVSMVPPTFLGSGEVVDDVAEMTKLASFINALEKGNTEKAMMIAADGTDPSRNQAYAQQEFDRLFHEATLFMLRAGGINRSNARQLSEMEFGKGMLVDRQTFQPLQKYAGITVNELTLAKDALAKGVSQTTLPGLYLQRLVRIMLPVLTPLRQRIPAVPAQNGATQAQWRVLQGFQSFDFAGLMQQAESTTSIGSTTGNGVNVNETPTLYTSPFTRLPVNNNVTLEAVAAARGYDDAMQFGVIESLSALLRGEEIAVLMNNSGSIPNVVGFATTGVITAASAATGGALAGSAGWTVKITALTGPGFLQSQKSGYAGGQQNSNAGESGSTSSSGSIAVAANFSGSTGTLYVNWPAVPGAVAYNVYLSDGAAERFNQTVQNTAALITTKASSGSAAPGTNTTANSNGWEGITQWCTSGSILGNATYNKTFVDAGGSALTLVQPNSIKEFDTVLSQLYKNWQIVPTLIVCSPQSASYAMKVMGSATNPAQRIFLQSGPQQGTLVGGMYANGYINKFAVEINGAKPVIPIMAHPYMPDGLYLFLTEQILYPVARETRGFLLEVLIPYTYFPFGALGFNYPFGLIVQETLECFHPGAQAAVAGVNVNL
jgi:hypothetical protein